ncbi:hypothetical protein PAXRUDRAFT_143523 [Paxillus rubicundulus Ve08.2h10]|uniref:Uncharacterized protein n=1 Tax=Paxillus rubicundulus Ve08.2h10 TaxID=930991 RepID=A0A0D0DPX0_9AGAM|nr:hypothetical protein PAXRUDRAFT_143523 [Paxillus rubicundulus Ve08.2h10]
MLQFRATSSIRPSCFRQWNSVQSLSQASRSSFTAPSESASSRSTTTDRLISLDDILTRNNRTRMATTSPDSEKLGTQKPQNSPGPSLLTRSFVARAPDGTQRTQRLQSAVGSAADGKRSASAVSLTSGQTTQTGGLTADRRNSKASSTENGAARNLLKQRTNTKTDAEGLSEENTAERAIKEESDERERTGHSVMPQTNLTELFASSSVASPQFQAALRLQFTRERGGDYSNYLPLGSAELGSKLPPADYAQLALGRNKQIPLKSQVGALDVIKQSIQGQGTKVSSLYPYILPVFIHLCYLVRAD